MTHPKGISDIIGVWNGRFIAIEVKRPTGGIVSPEQNAFIMRIKQAGGIAFIARSVDDVIRELDLKDRFLF